MRLSRQLPFWYIFSAETLPVRSRLTYQQYPDLSLLGMLLFARRTSVQAEQLCHPCESRDPVTRFLDSRWSLPRTAIRGGNDRNPRHRRTSLPTTKIPPNLPLQKGGMRTAPSTTPPRKTKSRRSARRQNPPWYPRPRPDKQTL